MTCTDVDVSGPTICGEGLTYWVLGPAAPGAPVVAAAPTAAPGSAIGGRTALTAVPLSTIISCRGPRVSATGVPPSTTVEWGGPARIDAAGIRGPPSARLRGNRA